MCGGKGDGDDDGDRGGDDDGDGDVDGGFGVGVRVGIRAKMVKRTPSSTHMLKRGCPTEMRHWTIQFSPSQ
jgi:hypothetical protein